MLHWRRIATLALQLAVLALLLAAFFVRMQQVSGPSMTPHIVSGEYVLINTLAYKFSAPHRGDIVAFAAEGDARGLFIKRVVGLPGDRVAIDNGAVSIGGTVLPEPYVRYADKRSAAPTIVPPGTVYVLGDNRADSEDSRSFGPVADARLIGRAIAGVWPSSALGAL